MKRRLEALEERGICHWDLRDSKTPSGKKLCVWHEGYDKPAHERSIKDRLGAMRPHEREQLIADATARLDRFQQEQARGKDLSEMPHGVRVNLLAEVKALLD